MSQTWDTLQVQMKECMKSGNKERLEVIRMLISDIKNVKINTPGGRDKVWIEAEITPIVAQYHKSLVKTMAEYPEDRRAKLKYEISVVEDFLPKQLTPDEIKAFISSELGNTSERNFGLLMKSFQEKLLGRADGKTLSSTLKSVLSELG